MNCNKTNKMSKLKYFRDDAFSGLESLEWLKLEDNSLTTLAGDGLFPKTLKVKNNLLQKSIDFVFLGC